MQSSEKNLDDCVGMHHSSTHFGTSSITKSHQESEVPPPCWQVKKTLLLGKKELHMLVEDQLEFITEEEGKWTPDQGAFTGPNYNLVAQDILLYLTHLSMMACPGSLLSTMSYQNSYMRWRNISINRYDP
jgi:hypothetical protein